ncbi:unnamed protein product, partial [Sphagnum balticum]
ESARVGTRLVITSARDADSGANGRIVGYSIVDAQPDNDTFSVAPANASDDDQLVPLILILQRPTDRERNDLYTLNVSAMDGGTPANYGLGRRAFATAHIRINVVDVNDNAPQFIFHDRDERVSVVIDWSTPIGAPIMYATATDSDAGDNGRIHYELFPDTVDYRLDNRTGAVLLARAPQLVANNTAQQQLRVIASDNGRPPLSSMVYVNVSVSVVRDTGAGLTSDKLTVDLDENTARNTRVVQIEYRPYSPDSVVHFQSIYTTNDSLMDVFPDGWLY